jgi:hypothetical protein
MSDENDKKCFDCGWPGMGLRRVRIRTHSKDCYLCRECSFIRRGTWKHAAAKEDK